MLESCLPCGSSPLTFNVQAFINSQCLDCSTTGCGSTIIASCVFYTGGNLGCTGINTNDNLDTILQKIDTQVCSIIGNYATYQMHCLPTYYGSAITQESQFVDAITSQVCALQTELVAFTGQTFPTYQTMVAGNFAAITDPLITCSSAGVTTADSLYTVLVKYCTKFSSIDSALNLSSVIWNTCFTVTSNPVTLVQAFDLLVGQICAVKAIASSAAVLPVFNNSGSCLSITGTADTLVATVNALRTRVCQSPTFDINTLTWGCLTKPSSSATDLQDAFQTVLTNLTTINQNILNTFSGDFVVTNVDNSNLCLGKHIALATPIVQDRFVASNPSDMSPGTLIQKLTGGTNVTLDATTTPGQVIINALNTLDFSGITSNSLDVTTPMSPSGNLTIELVPSIEAGNILILGTDGLPYVPANSVGIISVTRAAMLSLISTNALVQGAKYLLNDYQTVYTQDQSGVTKTGPTEPLVLTATAVNQLSTIAYSVTYPQDIIYYNITNDSSRVPGCTKGYIFRRIATDLNIDMPLDWRIITYRRYNLNVTATWSSSTTYAKNAVVVTGSDIYVSNFSANLNNVLFDAKWWRKFDWSNATAVSPTQTNWVFGGVTFPVDNTTFIDYEIFGQGISSTTFNIKIDEALDQDLISSNNTVFLGTNISENKIGNKFTQNTIGDVFQNNLIGDTFRYNSIAANFTFNRVDYLFEHNIIGTLFKNNIIETSVSLLTINTLAEANTIRSYTSVLLVGDSFINNEIGLACLRNTFGSSTQLNQLGDYSADNIFGITIQGNIIGTNAQSNTFGDDCEANTIGKYFSTNIVGSVFQNNKIDHYCNTNTFGINNDSNIIGLGFNNCTISSGFQNNVIVDYCDHLTIGASFFSNQILYPLSTVTFSPGTSFQTYINKQLHYNQALTTSTNNYSTLVIDNTTKIVQAVTPPFLYDAQISQSGTADPTMSVWRNSFPTGSTIVWTRTSAGLYTATFGGSAPSLSRTNVYIQPLDDNLHYVSIQVTSSTTITVFTADYATNTGTDALLGNISLKIERFQ